MNKINIGNKLIDIQNILLLNLYSSSNKINIVFKTPKPKDRSNKP